MNTIKKFAIILSFCVQYATSLSASCTFLGSTELSLSWVSISPEDVESGDLAACFDKFGRENIEKLRMTDSGNYFTSLPDDLFQDMVNMEYIAIESNGLTTLPSGIFEELGSLKEIGLSENYDLTSLPEGIFNGLESLETITLSDCGLSTLPDDIFQGMTALVTLSLHGNTFRTLPDNIFEGLVSLEELRLSENELIELSPGIFSDLTKLLELHIDDNYLLCYPQSLARKITADDGIFECEGEEGLGYFDDSDDSVVEESAESVRTGTLGSSGTSGTSSKTGIIAGSVAGSVAILGLLAFLAYKIRVNLRIQKRKEGNQLSKKSSNEHV